MAQLIFSDLLQPVERESKVEQQLASELPGQLQILVRRLRGQGRDRAAGDGPQEVGRGGCR